MLGVAEQAFPHVTINSDIDSRDRNFNNRNRLVYIVVAKS